MAEDEHDTNRPAPGELWRVQRLINTFDVEDGTDALTGGVALAHDLAGSETVELEPVRALREALRGLLLSHNGEPVDADAVAALYGALTRRGASPSRSRRMARRGWARTDRSGARWRSSPARRPTAPGSG